MLCYVYSRSINRQLYRENIGLPWLRSLFEVWILTHVLTAHGGGLAALVARFVMCEHQPTGLGQETRPFSARIPSMIWPYLKLSCGFQDQSIL